MKLLWLTDLHFDFLESDTIKPLLQSLNDANADAVMVGGDVGEANTVTKYLARFESELRCSTYFVLGNHDYYRSSIQNVRATVSEFVRNSKRLVWLNEADVVSLTPKSCLVGHDGWGDARLGNALGSPVFLNDFVLINELRQPFRHALIRVLNDLGDEAAAHFRDVLPDAVKNHEHVFVLTHVPPFREATWHEGRISDEDWLPFFSCKAVGDVLREIMSENPKCKMEVYCGHTHGGGRCSILPNLVVHTGKVEYRKPGVPIPIIVE